MGPSAPPAFLWHVYTCLHLTDQDTEVASGDTLVIIEVGTHVARREMDKKDADITNADHAIIIEVASELRIAYDHGGFWLGYDGDFVWNYDGE